MAAPQHSSTEDRPAGAASALQTSRAAHALVLSEERDSGLADALERSGFGVLRLSADPEDILTRVDALEPLPHLVVGHGALGALALEVAAGLPSVRAVATIGAAATPESEAAAAALGRPLLLLHAPEDVNVPVHDAARLYKAARHPRSFIALDGADHALSAARDAAFAGEMIARWAARYLDERPDETTDEAADDPSRAEAYRSARSSVARTESGLRTRVGVRGFALSADEPSSVGGTETAPTPVDYLAVALSSCTAMTLRMYADRKGWPLQAAVVSARQRKPQEGDAGARFERTVALSGDLDDEQRARLLEIADRCPVHRTLEGPVTVVTTLEASAAHPDPGSPETADA